MTKLFMGHKDGVGAVLKIMTNDTDDPLTTPNTEYSKFRFNSETINIGYVYDTYSVVRDFATYPPNPGLNTLESTYGVRYYYNADETYANAKICRSKGGGVLINLTRLFGGGRIMESRHVNSSGIYTKDFSSYYQSEDYYNNIQYHVGTWLYSSCYGLTGPAVTWNNFGAGDQNFPWALGDIIGGTGLRVDARVNFKMMSDYGPLVGVAADPNTTLVATLWNLPVDNTPLPTDGPYSANKKMFVASPSVVKMARTGFDADTASYDELLFSSEKTPAKILKSGELSLAANSNVNVLIPIEFPLTGTVYVDYMIRIAGQAWRLPFIRTDGYQYATAAVYINYKIDLVINAINIINPTTWPVEIRYMIIADDAESVTSGGTGNVIQTGSGFQRIKRPGSSNTSPSWSDVILDSRLSYLPILAEGFFVMADMITNTSQTQYLGFKKKTYTFTNDNLKPFVKFCINSTLGVSYNPTVRHLGGSLRFGTGGQGFGMTRESVLAELTDTSVTFYANPAGASNIFNPAGESYAVYDGATAASVRWYIFGIPN